MKKKDKQYVVVQDIVIPAGTVLKKAPSKIEYLTTHYDAVLAVGKDEVASFIIDEEAIEAIGGKIVSLCPDVDLSK